MKRPRRQKSFTSASNCPNQLHHLDEARSQKSQIRKDWGSLDHASEHFAIGNLRRAFIRYRF
jgi:hypothetical protein